MQQVADRNETIKAMYFGSAFVLCFLVISVLAFHQVVGADYEIARMSFEI